MDPRERINDEQEVLRAALDGRQAQIWTTLPGIIQSFDPSTCSASVSPAIAVQQRQPDGSLVFVNLPKLIWCPVKFPQGGGLILTFPIQPGNECVISFSSRALDNWWQLGGVQPYNEFRMHDLSDGFVEVGVRSKARPITSISTTSAQLRNEAGDTFVEIEDLAKTITLTAPSGVTINANVVINGSLHVTGEVIAGFGTLDDVTLTGHKHPDPQGGQTGSPIPGT